MYQICNAVGLLDNSEFGKSLKIFQSLENQPHEKKTLFRSTSQTPGASNPVPEAAARSGWLRKEQEPF